MRQRPLRTAEAVVTAMNRASRRAALQATASTRHLQTGMTQRRAAEAALRRSGKQSAQLLAECQRLQTDLEQLAREGLSAQEAARQKLSLQLRNDIAQTLLGIQVRLLALKNATAAHPDRLGKEIASTQRLVVRSVKLLSRFVRELDIRQRA